MKRQVIKTADGSTTIKIEDWDEQYHSLHGAIAEAKHVFMDSALKWYLSQNPAKAEINILEIGFGTGLNTILTKLYTDEHKIKIRYCGVEAYPISNEEVSALNYSEMLQIPKDELTRIHKLSWGENHTLTNYFNLKKINDHFENLCFDSKFDIIYFDAFGPRVQPDLWTEKIFKIMNTALKRNGVLTTYSAKGSARRAMIATGLSVKKIPGPPGKREMLRAVKW